MKSMANRNQPMQDASSSRTVKRRKTGSEAEEDLDDDQILQSKSSFLLSVGEGRQATTTIIPNEMATADYVEVVDVTDSQMSHDDYDESITLENYRFHDNSSDHSFLDPDDEALHFFHMHHESSEYDEDDYGDVGFPLFAPSYLLDAGDDEDDEDEEDEYYSDGFDGYAFPEELDRFTQMFDFIHQLMSRRNNILGNYIPDDEFDDSYEALLRLSERIGEVKQRGFNQMQVDSLPTKLYQPELSPTPTQKEETSCPICLEAFLPNCKLMYFECGHQFHSECSKRWLRQRSTCPVCRIEMPPPVIDLREDD